MGIEDEIINRQYFGIYFYIANCPTCGYAQYSPKFLYIEKLCNKCAASRII